jgi:hypothetical protein
MKRIKAFLGYTMAALCIVISFATFMGMDSWCQLIVKTTGLKISQWITGDVVINTVDHGNYKTRIHKPVFQGLFSEHQEGFIQIDWVKVKELPARITEEIDYNGDGIMDFSVQYAGKNRVSLHPYNPQVLSVDSSYKMEDSYAVRIKLKNKK